MTVSVRLCLTVCMYFGFRVKCIRDIIHVVSTEGVLKVYRCTEQMTTAQFVPYCALRYVDYSVIFLKYNVEIVLTLGSFTYISIFIIADCRLRTETKLRC